MFNFQNKNEKLRQKALKSNPTGKLKTYLEKALPDKNLDILEVDYLALDFETTGLDHRTDHIISFGYTIISKNRIKLKHSNHHLVNTSQLISKDSVQIHKITDDQITHGMSIRSAMDTIVEHLTGKVLLVHYQNIEYNFIQQLSMSLYGHKLPMLVVDTLLIEKSKLERANSIIKANQLRLSNLRTSYHLPRYHAHNAMEDAIATAELFLAQISHRQIQGLQLKLIDVLS